MSTYKQIAGTTVKAYTTNPSDPQEGEMWYNQTTLKLRGVTALGAWSSGGFLVTPGFLSAAFGSQTAAVNVGGTIPGPVFRNDTQEYNGTGWSSGTDYPSNISNSGRGGTSTAGIVLGGNTPPYTTAANEYDGSTWTSTGSLPTAGDNFGSCSTETQTNGIFAQGRNPSSGNAGNDKTFTYDGSTFSAGPDINTGRIFAQSSGGTGTAGIIYGGFIDPSPNAMTNTEEYDGSSWTTGGALNRASGLNCGFGVQTNAVAQVNTPGYKGTENYDGTAWTNLPDMALADNGANYSTAAGATGNAGFITCRGPGYNQTEEWNFSAQVVTPGAWASGGNLPTATKDLAGAGIQTAALAFGGKIAPGPVVASSYSYDGSSWTATPSLSTAREHLEGVGTSTAALAAGGSTGSVTTATEEFGGSWTAGGALPTATQQGTMVGTQTASLYTGGGTPSRVTTTYEYDGSSWTGGTAIPTATEKYASAGTQSLAIVFGGTTPGTDYATTTFEWDNSSWTTGGSLITGRNSLAGNGTQTAALAVGGYTGSNTAVTEGYDGTSWSTRPSLSTARRGLATSTPAPSALSVVTGGTAASELNATEEFTGETTSANTVDITTAE